MKQQLPLPQVILAVRKLRRNVMRAIVLAEAGRFEAIETERALEPREGEALVRVLRVGVCGTDIHAFHGRQPFFSYPRILGHELAVEVVRLGLGSAGSVAREGDVCAVEPYLHCGACRACVVGKTNCCEALQVLGVHTDGGMRPFLLVPVEKLHPASGLSLEQAALVETLAIGCHAVSRSLPSQWPPGSRVLVIGAGPIGLSAVQWVQARGVQPWLLDVSGPRRAFCSEKLGVQRAFAPQELPESETFDIVFDATGNPASMNAAFNRVAHGGTLVFVGLFPGEVMFHDPLFHRREITLLASRNALPQDFHDVIAAISCGKIDTTPWITHSCNFGDFIPSFDSWLQPDSGLIKGIVNLS
jgi:2-desacetyl-2-hydroxyethyl bacteriochlorophyllide A dehydrogenase